MAEKNFKISYDVENDIISIFEKGAKSKFSFDISLPKGDFVLDFGFDGKIVGLEFFNASAYFPGLNKIDKNKLDANLNIVYGKDWAEVHLEISSPELGKPLTNMIISPYNKDLIIES